MACLVIKINQLCSFRSGLARMGLDEVEEEQEVYSRYQLNELKHVLQIRRNVLCKLADSCKRLISFPARN